MSTIMNWKQLLSTTRFQMNEQEVNIIQPDPNNQQDEKYRTPFHVDYDRLVFSNAFRRLGRKTQVHPLAKNDHTHNRLTHSVEVSSVGRSLGRRVGAILAKKNKLPKNIDMNDIGVLVQVACLAHDLGNPPFGHIGEDALRQWFRDEKNKIYLTKLTKKQRRDVQTYEGNAHSLRQIASLEMYGKAGGMRLTAATIGSLLKYPWTSSHKEYGNKKFNIYQTELPYIHKVAHTLGLPKIDKNCWARHPLSYLMEAADDICYALMDLEDAIDLELLTYQEVYYILRPLMNDEPFFDLIEDNNKRTQCTQIARMRGKAINLAIEDIAEKFMEYENSLLNGKFPKKDLLEIADSKVRKAITEAKDLARKRIFPHRSKLTYELAAFPCVASLLDLLIPAAYQYITLGSKEKLTKQQQLALDLLEPYPIEPNDDLYSAYMKILDYIGGMTDNYAAQVARELSGISII